MSVTYQGINLQHKKAIESSVTVPDCWDVTVDHQRKVSLMEVETPGAAPDQDNETLQDEMFPGGMVGEFHGERSPTSVAENIIAMVATSAFHESLECVKLDGNHIAIPHPKTYSDSSDMWNWLQSRMLEILSDYQKRYPTS